MSDKRMRPIVKLEPGGGDAQEQQAAAAATGGSRQRRRGDVGEPEEGAGAELELEVQRLRANAEAQAFAFREMERVRRMGEELLRLKAQLAGLQADMRVKDAALAAEVLVMEAAQRPKEAALQARAAAHKAEFAFLLQSNEAAQQARDAVVLSTALFPYSSDAAHRAPFVLLSPDRLTVTRTSGDTLARARSERSWPAFPLDAAQ